MDLLKFLNTNMDLFLVQAGYEDCSPGFSNQILSDRSMYFHFIYSGRGEVRVGAKKYKLGAGDGFFIPKGIAVYYGADENNPWHYMWFEVYGKTAEDFFDSVNLNKHNPIYKCNDIEYLYGKFSQMFEAIETENPYEYMAAFLKLMDAMHSTSYVTISKKGSGINEYAQICIAYIKSNYRNKITIEELCDIANVERSYLYRIFKSKMNMSPQKYVIDYKLKMAAKLLEREKLSVSDVAKSVGYDDQFAFSKLFKKMYKVSPSKYRKYIEQEEQKIISKFHSTDK